MKDKLGNEINVGDYIIYGHALGRCAGLRFGKVLATKNIEPAYRGDSNSRITVWGIDDDWSFREAAPLSKKSTLMFPERVLVVQEDRVPAKYKDMLRDKT